MTKYDMDKPGMRLIQANLAWDLVPHADVPNLLIKLGLTPPGLDGQRMECRTSHARMARVDRLENDIDFLAEKIAEIAIKVMLGDAAEKIDDSIVSGLVSQYEAVIGAAVKVVVANFLAVEMLTYPEKRN